MQQAAEEKAKAIQQAKEAESSEDDEVAQAPTRKSKQSAFAFLNDAGEDEDEDDIEPDIAAELNAVPSKQKPKSKLTQDASPTTKSTSTSKKKKKKKTKGAKGATSTNDADEEEDIDAVLAALARENHEAATGDTTNNDEIYGLSAVESQHLHAINEMRHLFGREAINERPRQPDANQRRRGGQRAQPDSRGFPALSLKRNIFVQGKEEWPRASTGGLGMEIVSKDHDTGVTEYRFVHSSGYQDTQRQYEIAVASMDPQRLVFMLQQNPYHIGTLLQVSEIMKHDRQHTEAGDMLERALFAFGRTVHSSFAAAMTAGKARLSFDRPENREFFLACWRYILDLNMRSTHRTVYEWAKLVYALAPEQDPYGMALVLDQYGIRANQVEHFLQLDEAAEANPEIFSPFSGDENRRCFSRALGFLRLGKQKEAREALRHAMEADRYTAHNLCKVLDIEPMPPALWAHHEAPSPAVALLSNMYTTRAKDLWNTAEAKALLKEVATALPKDTTSSGSKEDVEAIQISTARHIYLTENENFLRLLASCTLIDDSDPRNAGDKPMQDPFPPATTIRSYDARPSANGGGAAGSASTMEGIPATILAALDHLPREQREAMMERLRVMQIEDPGWHEQGSDGEWREMEDE